MYCVQCGQWVADGETACPRCGTAVHGTAIGPLPAAPAPAAAPVPELRYGGFWRRLATGIVDGIVLFFPFAIVRVLMGGDVWGAGGLWANDAWRWSLVNGLLGWLYCALLESSPAQGTLGQQLLGLRVCNYRLGRVGFGRATGRHFGQVLSALTCGLGYLVQLFTKRRQTLHDLIAGCVLVRADSLPPEPAPPGGRP